MISVVRELPPRDSWRMRVNFESRYGMWLDWRTVELVPCNHYHRTFHTFPSVSALMTIPRAERDLLIFLASSKVVPDAPVFPTFSEPARSTRYKFPVLDAPLSVFRCWIVIRKME